MFNRQTDDNQKSSLEPSTPKATEKNNFDANKKN
jgi:hypothetical protein